MDFFQITEKSFEIQDNLRSEIQRSLSGKDLEQDEPQGFQGEGVYFGIQPPKMRADQYLQASTGWVYGCVNRIANSIAAIEICLYKMNSAGEIEEVLDHPAQQLLDQVNDHTTRLDHFHLTQEYLELAGEAPWFINRGQSGTGEPVSIMLLRPDKLTIVQNDDVNSDSPIKGYKYRPDANTVIEISIDELIFLKYPDPINYFRGKGTLQAAAKVVDIDNFSEDYNKRFFYNSARPDMVLQSDQKLTGVQRQTLQSSIRKLYQGGEKAHKTLILESGLKATPYSVSQKDMDFLEQQRYDMSKIFSIFGVPKSVMAVSDDVNLANAKVGEYIFMKYTIVPKLKRIVGQLNEFYLPMFAGTEQMFFSFENPIPADTDAMIKKYDSALGKGWMTPNEVRAEENLSDIGPDGDILYVPTSIRPIDQAGDPLGAGAPIPAKQVAVKSSNKSIRHAKTIIANSAGGYNRVRNVLVNAIKVARAKANEEEKIVEIEKKIDSIALAMVKTLVRSKKEKAAKQAAQDKNIFAEFGGIFLANVKTHEQIFKVATDAIFQQQKAKILARAPKKALNEDDWMLDEEEEATTMVRVYSPLMKNAIKDAGSKAAKLVANDGTFDDATKVVQNYIKNRTFDFSFEMNQQTNKLLGDQLAEAVAAGESILQIRGRVSDLFDNMEEYRSERIARTEVVSASNFAATEAYDQSGVVNEIQWLATEDDRTDGECASLDGTVIDLGASFAENDYFGDVEYPPIHANCRCTVVPVI